MTWREVEDGQGAAGKDGEEFPVPPLDADPERAAWEGHAPESGEGVKRDAVKADGEKEEKMEEVEEGDVGPFKVRMPHVVSCVRHFLWVCLSFISIYMLSFCVKNSILHEMHNDICTISLILE